MQNYEQILQELGIEVPEDKKAELKNKMGENYKTISDYNNAVKKRDEYKQSLDDVQKQLDGFKDVDVDDLKNQISTLTTQLNDEKNARKEEAERVQMESTVNEFLASTDEKGEKKFNFLNEITEKFYRDALVEELKKDTAKGKSINEIFTPMITDADGKMKTGIFVNKAEIKKIRFSNGSGRSNSGGKSGKEILAEMSLDERMKLKSEDPEYYNSLRKGE